VSELAIEVHGLRKSYGSFEAVRGIEFVVRRGEVFGLLGPNGAGKTTTVEILEGYRERTDGRVAVLGFDPGDRPRALRSRVGIVLQSTGLYRHIKVREALAHFAAMYPHPRDVEEVIALTGLGGKEDALARTLSGGQLRRLDLALALVGDPELIFLDEPTTGFDPAARRHAWATVRSLCELGKTVFLTTHFMDEAQTLANRVAVLREGEIIAAGRPDELGGRDQRPTEIRFRLPPGRSLDELPALPRAEARTDGDGGVLVLATDGVRTANAITGWALEHGVELERFSVSQPSLEDIYLALTGSGGDPAQAELTR
jgi:ABC-2 type transport system ATP-binding protein